MSHFSVLVLVPPDITDTRKEVERLLAPYSEDDEWFREADGDRPASRWDWWTIGGRWTGHLTGYDPRTDPANWETCDICGGTGDRATWRNESKTVQHPSGCNGCEGKGTRVKWTLAPYDGDVQPLAKVAEGFVPYALVTPDGQWHERAEMGWWGVPRGEEKEPDQWEGEVARLYVEHRECVAVLVDCHV